MSSEIHANVEVRFDDLGDKYSLIIRNTPDNKKWTELLLKEENGNATFLINFPNEDLDNVIKALNTFKSQVELLN